MSERERERGREGGRTHTSDSEGELKERTHISCCVSPLSSLHSHPMQGWESKECGTSSQSFIVVTSFVCHALLPFVFLSALLTLSFLASSLSILRALLFSSSSHPIFLVSPLVVFFLFLFSPFLSPSRVSFSCDFFFVFFFFCPSTHVRGPPAEKTSVHAKYDEAHAALLRPQRHTPRWQ